MFLNMIMGTTWWIIMMCMCCGHGMLSCHCNASLGTYSNNLIERLKHNGSMALCLQRRHINCTPYIPEYADVPAMTTCVSLMSLSSDLSIDTSTRSSYDFPSLTPTMGGLGKCRRILHHAQLAIIQWKAAWKEGTFFTWAHVHFGYIAAKDLTLRGYSTKYLPAKRWYFHKKG